MIDVNHLCPGCMGLWEDTGRPCPHCGFSWETAPAGGRELPIFTILAGRYLLGRRIGIGGFGITYLAMDLTEERVTAIKEFFPASLAGREGLEVAALPGEEGRYFREALRSFRKEADLLSRFADVPGIVRYRDYVTENGTAYLVMDYIEGTNLRRYMRETGKTFTQEEALGLMRPILLAVDAMHRKNVLHRDISPENLILKPDGTLTLIDFGAAREFSLDEEENLTVILKHGYAPEEQYHSGSRQGPWTDLYACCAVLYQMVSGIQPQDAAARAQKDNLLTLDEIEGVQVTEKFARVIEKGMTIHATERYASIQALMAELYGDDTGQPEQKKQGERQEDKPQERKREKQESEKAYDDVWSTVQAKEEVGFEQGQPVLSPNTASSPEKKTADSVSDSGNRKSPGKTGIIMAAAAAALVVLVALLVFRVIPLGGSGSASDGMTAWDSSGENQAPDMQEDGIVWLMTGQTDTSYDTPVQYLYEYNERGHYSRIVSDGISAHNYVNMFGGSAGIDSSFGEIVSDFTYEYDENNRILSSVQKTDEGKEYQCQYVYWNEMGELPRQVLILGNGTSSTFYLDESGRLKEVEVPDGSYDGNIYLYYNGESVTIRERIYCPNPVEEESLSQFIKRYQGSDLEFYGVDYEMSEDGKLLSWELNDTGDGSVYAERYSEEEASSAEMTVSLVKEYYRTLSPDSSGEKDEAGNVLEHNGISYSYAEYEVKDGIYTPTGRTSGTLPEISGEVQRDDSEEIQEDGSGNFTGGTEGASSENTASFADTGKQDDLLELLERYGIGYMTVDEVKEEHPDDAEEYIVTAMRTGELMSLVGCRITTLEGLAPGFYAVLPPEDWFLDDGTEAWTILTADMRTCWDISEALLEEGYYAEGGKAWGFFGQLSDTGADAEGNGLIYQEDDPLRFEIYEQYLEYWGERTGKDWSISNPDTGETVSKSS